MPKIKPAFLLGFQWHRFCIVLNLLLQNAKYFARCNTKLGMGFVVLLQVVAALGANARHPVLFLAPLGFTAWSRTETLPLAGTSEPMATEGAMDGTHT